MRPPIPCERCGVLTPTMAGRYVSHNAQMNGADVMACPMSGEPVSGWQPLRQCHECGREMFGPAADPHPGDGGRLCIGSNEPTIDRRW
jgi:hypothetical protein